MKTWTRAPSGGQLCGRCGQLVVEGSALLIVTGTSTWRFFRCAACAALSLGESAPREIPAPEAVTAPPLEVPPLGHSGRVSPIRRPVPLATIAKDLPFDARMAQTGEREPGEDDA